MIALCVLHHGQADEGAFTVGQLRALKDPTRNQAESRLRGRFAWRRDGLVLLAGGNWWSGCEILLQCGPIPIIWLSRDQDGYELLNVDLFDALGVARLQLRDNDWVADRDVDDLVCTPRRASLIVKTATLGAELSVSFERATREVVTKRAIDILRAGYRDLPEWVRHQIGDRMPSPEEHGADTANKLLEGIPESDSALCVIEGQLRWPVEVALEPTRIVLPGHNVFTGGLFRGTRIGIQLG
jgi:hypothetical protein